MNVAAVDLLDAGLSIVCGCEEFCHPNSQEAVITADEVRVYDGQHGARVVYRQDTCWQGLKAQGSYVVWLHPEPEALS